MKKLVQIDLTAEKKRPTKKQKVEDHESIGGKQLPTVKAKASKKKVEEERETTGGKQLPAVKEKKPPTEKQLAAREKQRLARLAKIEQVKLEKAALDEEIRLKAEEVEKKKQEIAEKRRLRKEEKKKMQPQTPVTVSGPIEQATPPEVKPTISEVLMSMSGNEERHENIQKRPQTPEPEERVLKTPNAPIKAQRFFNYPFGRNALIKPRFR